MAYSIHRFNRRMKKMSDCMLYETYLRQEAERARHGVVIIPEHIAIGIAEYIEQSRHKYNAHEVACILAELFDDNCACNFSGIDEWLPEYCEVIDACPNPDGVACWEQYLKHKEKKNDEQTH